MPHLFELSALRNYRISYIVFRISYIVVCSALFYRISYIVFRISLCVARFFIVYRISYIVVCSALFMNKIGAPDRIRTCGLRLRRQSLYPAELRAQISRYGKHLFYLIIFFFFKRSRASSSCSSIIFLNFSIQTASICLTLSLVIPKCFAVSLRV